MHPLIHSLACMHLAVRAHVRAPRSFSMAASDEEEHHLLCLSTQVLSELSRSWTRLRSLHYAGGAPPAWLAPGHYIHACRRACIHPSMGGWVDGWIYGIQPRCYLHGEVGTAATSLHSKCTHIYAAVCRQPQSLHHSVMT